MRMHIAATKKWKSTSISQMWPVLVAVALVEIPLFSLQAEFHIDWINHLWSIQYFAEYLKSNAQFPTLVNSAEIVGMPYPVFYAQKFYSLCAVLSIVMGSPLAVRVLVSCALVLQYRNIYITIKIQSGKTLANIVAMIVTWEIYPLTNLYNRGALPEFFAVTLLTCSLMAFWRLHLRAGDRGVSRLDFGAFGLYYVAAALTHPLTAVFGALFLLAILIPSVAMAERTALQGYVIGSAVVFVLVLLCIGPWLYVLSQFHGALPVTDPAALQDMFQRGGFFPSDIDSPLARLWPFPRDLRVTSDNLASVSSPYLDAQMSFPLLLINIGLVISLLSGLSRGKRTINGKSLTLGLLSLALSVVFCVISCKPGISSHVGGFFDILQFPYRLVTYVNIALLSATVGLVTVMKDQFWFKAVVAVSVMVAVVSVPLKLVHAFAVRTLVSDEQRFEAARPLWSTQDGEVASSNWVPSTAVLTKNLTRLPTTYYGAEPYSVIRGFGFVPSQSFKDTVFVAFPVQEEPAFGTTTLKEVTLDTASLVITNIQQFPWNHVVVDGRTIPQSSVLIGFGSNAAGYPGLGVQLDAGHHVLEYVLETPKAWSILNAVSWTTVLVWFTVIMAWWFLSLQKKSTTGCCADQLGPVDESWQP